MAQKAAQEEPDASTIEIPVDSAYPSEEPENETATESSTPISTATSDAVTSPDEEESSSDSDDAPTSASQDSVPTQGKDTSPAHENAATGDADRWAGTMTHEWNENEKQAEPNAPQVARKTKAPAKLKMTVAKAVEKIPADALKYIRDNFKTDIQHIRSYDPANGAKSVAVVVTHKSTEDEKEEDLGASDSES